MTLRAYGELTGVDASRVGAQIDSQRARLAERLAAVRWMVAVMSGKGGVGKSYVTALLARAAATRLAKGVGVLDADLPSPTVAHMLGAEGRLVPSDDGVEPVRGAMGVRVVSSAFLLADDTPLRFREPHGERWVWRGALQAGVLREFLADVRWGTLDLLLVDLPPGPDGVTDLAHLLPSVDGVVAVTIPSEESRRSVARTATVARDAGVRILGIVENMAGYACAECGTPGPLFKGDAGRRLAKAFDVPLLGRLPFRPAGAPDTADRDAEALTERLLGVLA